ncbi:hypothetical protein [Streptomyces sp. NPDC005890]|uniref:WD40 repeat domain-containing protein n=1 Tax=Streptomyces sp. NPDC005890 TaxID=3154568 RepID=UPI0033D4FA02
MRRTGAHLIAIIAAIAVLFLSAGGASASTRAVNLPTGDERVSTTNGFTLYSGVETDAQAAALWTANWAPVHYWEIQCGEPPRDRPHEPCLMLSGVGRLWDITDPKHPAPVGDPLIGHTATVDAIVLSPGSRMLATVSDDGTTRLWDLDIDRVVHRICAFTGNALTRSEWSRYVGSLAYRPPC